MVRVKLRCIMGCPGLKGNYREKGLLEIISEKKLFNIQYKSAFSETFLPASFRLIFSLFEFIFEKRGTIVFQKDLLSLILLMFK